MSPDPQNKELNALLRKLREQYSQTLGTQPEPPAALDATEPLLGQFLRAFLLWESTTAKAAAALKRLEQAFVDFNELRIAMPDELASALGERYPRGAERALRIRTALNRVYARQHKVTLENLTTLSKREAREYLESLDGVPGFVSARVSLLGLSGHSAPVDSRIHRRLMEAGVLPEDTTPEDGAGILEKRTRAGELPEVYALLQAWADDGNFPPAESHLEFPKLPVRPAGPRTAVRDDSAASADSSARASARKRSGRGGSSSRAPRRRPGRQA